MIAQARRLLGAARLDPVALAAGGGCAFLLAWGLADLRLPAKAGVPLAFVLLSLAPGHLLSRSVRLPRPMAALEWPVDAAIGLSLSLIAATLAVRLDLSIDFVPVAVGSAGVLALVARWLWPEAEAPSRPRATWLPNLPLLALAVTAVILVSARATQTGSELPLYADTWAYLRFVRQFETDDLRVQDPYERGDDVEARMQFPGWLALQAVIARLGSATPLDAYTEFLPAALALVAFGALFSQVRELFAPAGGPDPPPVDPEPGSSTAASPARAVNAGLAAVVAAGLLFGTAISADGAGYLFMTRLGEDKFFLWFVLMPVAFALSLRFLDGGPDASRGAHAGNLALAALAVTAIAMTHPLGVFQFAVYFGAFAAVEAIFRRRRGHLLRGAALGLVVLACTAVPLSQRAAVSEERVDIERRLSAQNPLDARRLWILSVEERRFMASPRLLLNPITIAGLLALAPLAFRFRRSRPARFVIVASVVPAFLVLTPVTAPLTARLISAGLLWRMLWLIPSAIALVVVAWEFAPSLGERLAAGAGRRSRAIAYATPALALGLATLALIPRMREQVAQITPLKDALVTAEEKVLLRELPTIIEPGSGVMTPPTFQGECAEPAFPEEGQADLGGGSEPPDGTGTMRCPLDLAYRLSAVVPGMYGLSYRTRILGDHSFAKLARFYNGPVLNLGKLQTVQQYDIDYVLFFNASPALPLALEAPEVFAPAYADATYQMFRVDRRALNAAIKKLEK